MRGPDTGYKPLNVPDVNPFRYVYPGTNNPSSYDLWVQLVINGKTNLICNWSASASSNYQQPTALTYVHQRRQPPGLLEMLAECRVA